jgi:hypothetical protein
LRLGSRAWILVIGCAGCLSAISPSGSSATGGGAPDLASGGGNASAGSDAPADMSVSVDAGTGLVPGTLAVSWMHGQADCSKSTDPELQVLQYNANTYIMRQDKCRTFEAPFVYVLRLAVVGGYSSRRMIALGRVGIRSGVSSSNDGSASTLMTFPQAGQIGAFSARST